MRVIAIQIIFVLCLLVSAACSGAEVNFLGARPNNASAIESLAASWSHPESPVDSVRSLLTEAGYLDASVELDGDRLAVTAGDLINIERLTIDGDRSFVISGSDHTTASSFFTAAESILEIYQDSGYYFASLKPSRISRSDSGLSIDLTLLVGPRVSTGSNQFKGLTRTDSRSLSKFLSVQGGELLTDDLVKKTEQEALDIPFVRFQPPLEVLPRPGYTTVDLGFNFSERKPLRLEGGAGYTSGDDSRLVWSLDLALVNLFGGGRTAQLQSRRPEKGRTILDISYSQPLFLIGVGELKAGISTRDYRDQFYEFEASSGYSFVPGSLYRTGIGFSLRSVEPSVDLPSFSAYSGLFSVRRETLDNKLNPSTGLIIEGSISYSYRRYSDDSSVASPERLIFSETRNKVSISWFYSLWGRLVPHLKLNYNGLETEEQLPPLSELVFLGGQGTLRGFRTERFSAIRAAFGTIEPRLRFESGFLFLFYDGAWLSNRISGLSGDIIIADEDYRFGYGVGLALIQEDRAVEISIGWNREVKFDQPRLLLNFKSGI